MKNSRETSAVPAKSQKLPIDQKTKHDRSEIITSHSDVAGASSETFNYELPSHLIAQKPSKDRAESRLMCIQKKCAHINHYQFNDLQHLLKQDDILVVNNSKVFNARILAKRQSGGHIEIFALKPEATAYTWTALIKNVKKLSEGETLIISNDSTCILEKKHISPGIHRIRFNSPLSIDTFFATYGQVPLPPYINENTADIDTKRYQTVYASQWGSVAAPTAGLHFTPQLIHTLKHNGIHIEEITLHVGYGTFKPIDADHITDHVMHSEAFHIDENTADRLNRALSNKQRIIAVGTTVVRTLESAFHNGQILAGHRDTDIFITPGFSFNVIGGLITNFHLPKSTLLCLVSAFAGHDLMMDAYACAIADSYRFYSFGDAMLILP